MPTKASSLLSQSLNCVCVCLLMHGMVHRWCWLMCGCCWLVRLEALEAAAAATWLLGGTSPLLLLSEIYFLLKFRVFRDIAIFGGWKNCLNQLLLCVWLCILGMKPNLQAYFLRPSFSSSQLAHWVSFASRSTWKENRRHYSGITKQMRVKCSEELVCSELVTASTEGRVQM